MPRVRRLDPTLFGCAAAAVAACLFFAGIWWMWVQQAQDLREILQGLPVQESGLVAERLALHERRLAAFRGGIVLLLVALLGTLAFVYRLQRRRQAAERLLLASERRFRLMTDSVTDYAIVMLDDKGCVQSWNTGAKLIEGYDAIEIAGRPFSMFFPPEDQRTEQPARALATADAGGRFAREGWLVRKDGSRFWATAVIGPLHDHGRVAGYCLIVRDLTELRRAQDAQLARELSARLIAAQEEERRRVARELHDETGQSLSSLRMRLDSLLALDGPQAGVAADCIADVERAIAHIRSLSLRLRPTMLDDLGLPDALQWMLREQARAAHWRFSIDVPELEARLPQELETACFRIAQEAITNAARHAGASRVHVGLALADGSLQLEVRDDGRGFDAARYSSPEARASHFGLVSMAERAALAGGRLEIDSAPGRGARVRAFLPLPP